MKCDWLEDITYMKRPEPPAERTIMPCPSEVVMVRYENGIIVAGLCQSHFDGKVYRRESVEGFEAYDPSKHYGVRELEGGKTVSD